MSSDTNQQALTEHLGQALREVRHSLGMSLDEVERKSDGRWRASVVGSYERAQRRAHWVTVVELAEWYGVPAASLLPGWDKLRQTAVTR